MLKFFERLPVVMIFVILIFGFFLGVGNMTRPLFRLKLATLDAPPLAGMRIHWAAPKFSHHAIMDGSFQKSTELLLEDVFPFRAAIVRSVNQVYYSLFARSYMFRNEVVIGKHQYLFETIYLQRYCNLLSPEQVRNDVTWSTRNNSARFDEWTKHLKYLNDFFTKRGKTFLFLITPSKAAHYPEHIPSWYQCNTKSPRQDYRMAISALSHARVPYIDLSKRIHDAKGAYPAPLFSRGGTHWTSLAVAFSVQDIVANISARGQWALPSVHYTFAPSYAPDEIDRDLLEILNLLAPSRHYLTSTTWVKPAPSLAPQAPRVAVIGGSFMGQLEKSLYETGLFSSVDYYYYMAMGHQRRAHTPPTPLSQQYKEAVYYREMLESDIIILEENEANLLSPHTDLLLEALASHIEEVAENRALSKDHSRQ